LGTCESKRGYATVENKLIKIDIDAQRQRAVGCSDLLEESKPI